MSLRRDVITAADDRLLKRLNLITDELIKEKPANAIWRLGLLACNLNPKKHSEILWRALEEKRCSIAESLSKNTELMLLINGILQEKIKKTEAAVSAYGYARNQYPYCWQAYLKSAAMLQKLNRYQDSVNILRKMEEQIHSIDSKSRINLISKKSMGRFYQLLADGLIEVNKPNYAKLSAQFGTFQNKEKAPINSPSELSLPRGLRK